MKSAIEKALEKLNINKVNVVEIEKEKPDDNEKDSPAVAYNPGPRLYLTDKDLEAIKDYKAGDKVILVLECCVEGRSSYSRMEGKDMKNTCNCDLCIEAIADITKR